MRAVIRHVLAPLVLAISAATVFIDSRFIFHVSWAQWVPTTLILALGLTLWWTTRNSDEPWITPVLAGLVAAGFTTLWFPSHGLIQKTDQFWVQAWVLAVTAVGAMSLASSRLSSFLWILASGTPLLVVSRGQEIPLVLYLGSWFVLAETRHRSIRKIVEAWDMANDQDPVTGLGHRRAFLAKGQRLLDRSGGPVPVVAILSLDRSRDLTQSLGLLIVDEILKALSQRVQDALGPQDAATRMDSASLAVVLAGGAPRLREVLGQVRGTYDLSGGLTVRIGVNAGWAPRAGDIGSVEAWLFRARLACAQLDERKANQDHRYDALEDGARIRRRQRAEDLERALVRHEFEMHFQTKHRGLSRRPVGVEALVRWNHPREGEISPQEFIPLAEETGFIVPLGQWILETTLQEAQRWPTDWGVAVNVAAAQLADPEFGAWAKRTIERYRIDPRRISLEITESTLITDSTMALTNLVRLRNDGMKISLDDFGTGYSSLMYIRTYPIDELKIDQSFVKNLDTSSESRSIVRAVISLARDLGIATIAEGVESEKQAELLLEMGCENFQGYWFSKPTPYPLKTKDETSP